MEGRFGPGDEARWRPQLLRGRQGASQAAPEVIRRAEGGRLGLDRRKRTRASLAPV